MIASIILPKYRWTTYVEIFLLITGGICFNSITAQTLYSTQDSANLYTMLDQADQLDFEGKLDEAIELINRVIIKSQILQMKRSLGFGYLKKADLLLKKSDYKDLLLLYNLGYDLGNELKDSLMMGLSFHQKAQFYRTTSEYEKALVSLQYAALHYPQQSDLLYKGMVFNDQAFIYDKQGNYSKSVESYFLAIQIFDKIGDRKEKANSLGNVAIAFYRLNDKKQAIKYFREALMIQESLGDIKRIASTTGNLVTVFSGISLDSALLYQNKLVALSDKLGIKSTRAQAENNLADLYFKNKDYNSAIRHYLQVQKLYNDLGDVNKIVLNYLNCAMVYNHISDSIQAELYFQKAFKLCEDHHLRPLQKLYYESKSSFYLERKNYEQAFILYKESVAVRDSLLSETTQKNIAQLHIQYETEKKELELAKLESERMRNITEIEKQQTTIRYNQLLNTQRQKEIQLLVKDQELQKAKLWEVTAVKEKQELLNQNQQKDIELLKAENTLNEKEIHQKEINFKALLAGTILVLFILLLFFNRYKLKKQMQEQHALLEIRNKIAKDLHDDIGSTLTSINILSKVSRQQFEHNPHRSLEMLEDIENQSQRIQQNMSDIVWAIRPDNEKVEALTTRLHEYCSKTLEAANIKFEYNIDESLLQKALPLENRKELLLISKELINNVVKHSRASHVNLSFQRNSDYLEFSVKDNGLWSGKESSSGTGLKSMADRAHVLGGEFVIHHNELGTTALVKIPLT